MGKIEVFGGVKEKWEMALKESMNYEILIKNLKKLIISYELLNIKDNNQLSDHLKDSYNKLFLYDLYNNKELITVTGLQGAGKTTLIKEYFNLPDDILPENNSRGEKLPIFISEDLIDEPQAFLYNVRNIDGEITIINEEIDINEVKTISMEPKENIDLWIEIKLPFEKIKNNSTKIVLLPGFEKHKKDYSQKLLEFIVNISKTSIIVLDKNTYARKSSNIILKKIENTFEGIKPIIAITHGDENPDENDNIKSDIINELKIAEKNRVIVTGPKSLFNDDWVEELTLLINAAYEANEYRFENRQSAIQEIIMDIIDTLSELKEVLDREEENISIDRIQDNLKGNFIEEFKNEYERYLDKLEKVLEAKIASFVDKKIDDILEIISQENKFLKNLKIRLFGEQLKDQLRFSDKIVDVWNGEKNNDKSAIEYINEVSSEYLEEYQNRKNILNYKDINNQNTEDYKIQVVNHSNSLEKINTYVTGDNSGLVSLNNEDILNLTVLGSKFLNSSYNQLNDKSVEKKVINQYEGKSEERGNTISVELTPLIDEKNIDKEESKLFHSLNKVVPVVLGIDILDDGKSDILGNLIKSSDNMSVSLASAGLKITSKQLLAVAGTTFIVGIAGYTVSKNIQDLNKREISLYSNGSSFVEMLARDQVKSYIESLRNVYETMEDKLRNKHLTLKGEFNNIGKIEECQYLLNRINNQTNKELDKYYNETILF